MLEWLSFLFVWMPALWICSITRKFSVPLYIYICVCVCVCVTIVVMVLMGAMSSLPLKQMLVITLPTRKEDFVLRRQNVSFLFFFCIYYYTHILSGMSNKQDGSCISARKDRENLFWSFYLTVMVFVTICFLLKGKSKKEIELCNTVAHSS